MSSFLSTKREELVAWVQSNSLWTYTVSGGCCANEMLALQGCRYDLERFGCLPQAHPEQADLLIVSTAVTERMSGVIKDVYDRMAFPKYVLAVGACANAGGAFDQKASYVGAGPLSDIIPVDVYVPGCPPRPEAIMNGLIRLQEKIRANPA
jgi:NADH-quinone oxidoreductase B subunit